jgi:hypothetical protein
MSSIQESMCVPNTGADLTRVNAFLDYIATKLSADDYKTATDLLWASVDPVYGARLNRNTT